MTFLASVGVITLLVLSVVVNSASRLPRLTVSPKPAPVKQSEQSSSARQTAEAEIDLLKRGQPNKVWSLMRHTSDPTVRSYLIHSFARLNVEPSVLIKRLTAEKDVSARRALILSLGEFTEEQLPAAARQSLVNTLLLWYRTDADPGIHSAIDWLLRHSMLGAKPRRLNWSAADKIQALDRMLAGYAYDARDWYLTNEGHTMVIVRRPAEFTAGSPEGETGRTADERPHRVRIPRSFAVATKEVTVDQFQRFLNANPKLEIRYPDTIKDPRRGTALMNSPEGDCPQIVVTWYEAAQYCNWLSMKEGLPQSEWVYPTDLNKIKNGMVLPANYLQRTGYRLLTEAEWEFVARAGSSTSRFYGSGEELLEYYAVYSKNPPKRKTDPNDPNDPQRTWRVGQLKPNDLGLFDIYGNVWEWIHDRRVDYPVTSLVRTDLEDTVLLVNDQQWRVRRGGSFSYDATVMRSAHRGRPDGYVPNERRDSVGFRVARTYPPRIR